MGVVILIASTYDPTKEITKSLEHGFASVNPHLFSPIFRPQRREDVTHL